ncbi:hypothetical protein PUR71_36065 [Streptomyces sp. SP17BM10]|uniref:Imm32 family immunity protein n=1 Tax=Streptomyces sp. SP17BM10 TaxID=3002530 RepID=UPI002E79FABE|nr:hypothetical protein [Streptomyces sp. SP17BM10]MEE1788274.1 hypothetical protein [Streptomyces sp. SP17BM10]
MQIEFDASYSMGDVSGSAEDLNRLARLVAGGEGAIDLLSSAPVAGRRRLAGVEVRDTPGPGVLVHLDASRRVLMISGDAPARAVLAENLRETAGLDDGGHLHIEYFPDHYYLAEGSLALVVNSPHGGMPRR